MQGNSHNRYELELLLVEDGPVNGEFTSHGFRCLGRMKFAFRKPSFRLATVPFRACQSQVCVLGMLILPPAKSRGCRSFFARPQSANGPGGLPWNF